MTRLDPEVYRILRDLDLDAAIARSRSIDGWSPETREMALAGLHKARLAAGRLFTGAERQQSREWLAAHGYSEEIRHG